MRHLAKLKHTAVLAFGAALAAAAGAAHAEDPTLANFGDSDKTAFALFAGDLGPLVTAKAAGPVRVAPVRTVSGAVASVVNVEGVRAGQLKLTGPVLADIFMGRITRWDAPQIASLNPGVSLPHKPITVVRQAGGANASLGFSSYLAAQSPRFRAEIGARGSAAWPVGVTADGDDGVAAAVRGTEDAIGYVDFGFAQQNGLSTARVIDGRSLPIRALAAPGQTADAKPARAPAVTAPAEFANFDKAEVPGNDAPQ